MTAPTGRTAEESNRERALKALYDDLSAANLFPFWATTNAVDHDENHDTPSRPAEWRSALIAPYSPENMPFQISAVM